MKVVTVVGARPQFVKAAAVSRLLRKRADEVLIHTGQHYADNMSKVFFHELDIPEPDINLQVGSGSHGAQTAAMLTAIESVLLAERPDRVLVYGDTNSTLAGALAAAKLHIPVAHVEAGLRSFNRAMPEEINRVMVDHLSELLLCPTPTSVQNLAVEGVHRGVQMVGDVMRDVLMHAVEVSRNQSTILRRLGVTSKQFFVATIHRAENTDDRARLAGIFQALGRLSRPVVLPLHPRTLKMLSVMEIEIDANIKTIEPVGYLDMAQLEQSAKLILTDSGGVQKEAFWLGVPCVTFRDETEWTETVESGWNQLVGADAERILCAVRRSVKGVAREPATDDLAVGAASKKCVDALLATTQQS